LIKTPLKVIYNQLTCVTPQISVKKGGLWRKLVRMLMGLGNKSRFAKIFASARPNLFAAIKNFNKMMTKLKLEANSIN